MGHLSGNRAAKYCRVTGFDLPLPTVVKLDPELGESEDVVKKTIGALALMCFCSTASGEDSRFYDPKHISGKAPSRDIERFLLHLKASYDDMRTIARTEQSRWVLDLKQQRLWLAFEKTL